MQTELQLHSTTGLEMLYLNVFSPLLTSGFEVGGDAWMCHSIGVEEDDLCSGHALELERVPHPNAMLLFRALSLRSTITSLCSGPP